MWQDMSSSVSAIFVPGTPHWSAVIPSPQVKCKGASAVWRTGKVCQGCRSNPHNLILSTHFIEDVISGSAGESKSCAGKTQIQAVCAGHLLGRHEPRKREKTAAFVLKIWARLARKIKAFFFCSAPLMYETLQAVWQDMSHLGWSQTMQACQVAVFGCWRKRVKFVVGGGGRNIPRVTKLIINLFFLILSRNISAC